MDKQELREWVVNKFYLDVMRTSSNEYQGFIKLEHICNWIETGNYETTN